MSKFLTDLQEQLNQVNELRTATTEKSGVDCSNKTIGEIAGVVSEIPAPAISEKDFNFFDYDGTLVYSYSYDELQALEELPKNPTHERLIGNGWSLDLETLKTLKVADVGAYYVTKSGNTEIDIVLDEKSGLEYSFNAFHFYDTEWTIDWGDGTQETKTFSGEQTISHTYQNYGSYMVSVVGIDLTNTNNKYNVSSFNIDVNNDNYSVRHIRYGERAYTSGSNTCKNCVCLQTISVHKDINSASFMFQNCYNLKFTSVSGGDQAISYCYAIKRLPTIKSIYTLSSYATYCYALERVIFPININNKIQAYCINKSYNCKELNFSNFTTIPILDDSSVFGTLNPLTKIVVPDELYDQWIIAENWSAYAQYIIKASDYKAVQNANN